MVRNQINQYLHEGRRLMTNGAMLVMKHKEKRERFFWLFFDGSVMEVTKRIQEIKNFSELYKALKNEGYYE